MKITVKQNKVKFNLYFPLFFLKSAAFTNLITKNEEIQISFKPYYRILKKYIKENGHFTLIDVADSEGNIVTITV